MPYVARKTTEKKRPRETVQTLGDHTYALPNVTSRRSRSSFSTTILRTALVSFCMPVYTITMIVAPKRIRDTLLSWVLPKILAGLAKTTHNQRKLLLQHVAGRVLDVGTGSGTYLEHFQGKASHVVCLEPFQPLHATIRGRPGWKDYQLTVRADELDAYTEMAMGREELLFDWIILGNVLCEVPDVEQALAHVDKLLKPGGHVYFCEHYASSQQGTLMRWMQNLANPVWRRISGGCNCNRDTLHALEGMPCWDIVSWELDLQVAGNNMVMGLARKTANCV